MKQAYWFNPKPANWRWLHKAMTIILLVALLAGLIPPPLVRTVLPAPVAALVEPVLPAAAPAAAAPLAQVAGSNVLTITKTVVGSANPGPYNITVTGPNGSSNNTTVSVGSPRVLTGLTQGVYTVTEASPGAGWVTTYTVGAMSNTSRGVVTLTNPITAAVTAAGQITGVVYNDYNSNGVRENSSTQVDTGKGGVIVTAYDRNGAVAGTATTDANGIYTLTTTSSGLSGPYRLEFTNLPDGYQPSGAGSGNGTSVQFVSAPATNVNFGVVRPSDYCQANPMLCLPIYKNGDASSTLMAMTRLNWNGTGTPPTIARQNQIGSVWGVAYKRDTKQLFASALVKRHSGLGSLGLGGIYVLTNPAAASPTVGQFVDLDAAPFDINFGTLPINSARFLGSVTTNPYSDNLAYPAAAKQGIGDIDLSEDGNTLWAVNLYTTTGGLGSLIKLDVSGGVAPSSATVFPLSNMSGLPTCTGGILRPWALKLANGKGYIGAVCSAETSLSRNNLVAYVLSFDPHSPTAVFVELSIPLTYTKGAAHNGNEASPHFSNLWHPWRDSLTATGTGAWPGSVEENESPVPVLSDIEFDNRGAMIIGFLDRRGMQWGGAYIRRDASVPGALVNTAGDILRACPNSSGVYILENNGSCGGVAGSGVGTSEGPGNGEFYRENGINTPQDTSNHEDPVSGGLAYWGGSTEIAASTMDPAGQFWSGGALWLNNTNGSRQRGQTVYAAAASFASVIETFAKSIGQGDIELLCDPAPIEIGNRVWNDYDGDGVQDPGEPGISGIQVSRQGPTNTVTTNTNSNGLYYFGNLQANTAYTLTVNAPAGYSLTTLNAQALAGASVSSNHAISDTIDSDASLVNSTPTIYYSTGGPGQTNHGLDVGFTQPVSGRVGIVNTYTASPGTIQVTKQVVTTDGSNPTVTGNFTINVSCPGSAPTPSANQTVAAGGSVTFGTIGAGTVCTISENTLNLPAAPSGYTWVNSQVTPSQVTAGSGVTTNVIARNTLAPLPALPTNVLTVTKTISGTGSGPFNITISGPSGYISSTTINGGQSKRFTGLVSGIYTVTEASPGAGWTTTYTATASTGSASGGGSNAVVNLTGSAIAPVAAGPISGQVYHDYNNDGAMTANGVVTDTGVSGVLVTAYDVNGVARGSTSSDATGAYSFTPTGSGPYRIEFSNLPAGYEPTTHGTGNGTSTQFVTTVGASNVNLGILAPCDYCQDTPRFAVATQLNGNPVHASVSSKGFLYSLPYDIQGTFDGSKTITVTTAGQVGALWGIAYQRATKQLYTSAVVKRHVGFGPKGIDGVYAFDMSSGTPTVKWSLALSTELGINVGSVVARDMNSLTGSSYDSDAFAKAGKSGIGDIDVSEDGASLWLVNLLDGAQSLIELDIRNGVKPTDVKKNLLLSQATGLPVCTNGTFRPWALKFKSAQGYLGGVCDASGVGGSKNDLAGYVLRFDPSSASLNFSTVLSMTFNYTKGVASVSYPTFNQWYPWLDSYSDVDFNYVPLYEYVYRATPMLSDIEFDASGDMMIGVADRATFQIGYFNNRPVITPTGFINLFTSSGDTLRACKNLAGTWTLETNASCGGVTAAGGVGNGQGPGNGEYYNGDSNGSHKEMTQGALAQLPGAADVMVSIFNPDQNFNTQGVNWLNNRRGTDTRGYELNSGINYTTGSFGKAGGMGDLELLCDPAPIEIGNRVWNDLDGDGVQDAGEPGLGSLTVSLQGLTNTVTTNTDSNGLYYFNNLRSNTAYTLTMNVPTGYSLTQANTQALSGAIVSSHHAISDTRDSDAVLIGGVATIYYTTGSAGQNNHGLDFGFVQPVYGQVGIINTAPNLPSYTLSKQLITPDPVRVGDDITFTIRITNTGSSAIMVLPLRDLYDTSKLLYLSANVVPDDSINDGQLDWSDLTVSLNQDLAAGASFTVTTVFVARSDTTALPGGTTLNLARVPLTPTQTVTAPVRIQAPTAVALAEQSAIYDLNQGVTLAWSTASEIDVVGFYVLRREVGNGSWVRLNAELIPARQTGQATGANYRFSDPNVQFGRTYLYLVEVVDGSGSASRRELGLVVAGNRGLLPLVAR